MSKAFISFTKESMQENQISFEIQNKEIQQAIKNAEEGNVYPAHTPDNFFKEMNDNDE